jgi:hypothetical protein
MGGTTSVIHEEKDLKCKCFTSIPFIKHFFVIRNLRKKKLGFTFTLYGNSESDSSDSGSGSGSGSDNDNSKSMSHNRRQDVLLITKQNNDHVLQQSWMFACESISKVVCEDGQTLLFCGHNKLGFIIPATIKSTLSSQFGIPRCHIHAYH